MIDTTPTPVAATDPFAPPGGAWQPVSPALVGIRRITSLVWLAVLVVPAVVLGVLVVLRQEAPWWVAPALFAGAVVLAIWPLWRLVRARAWVESWGWCERDEDLCVRSGLMFRRLVVVPMGRLQLVKVSAGPLLRSKGLSRVEMVTATAQTDVHLPGLPSDVAAQLRDRLIEASDARGSGL